MTTLVGRLLPVPAKLNLITQVSIQYKSTLDLTLWHASHCTYVSSGYVVSSERQTRL
jgi:hypothetical protein